MPKDLLKQQSDEEHTESDDDLQQEAASCFHELVARQQSQFDILRRSAALAENRDALTHAKAATRADYMQATWDKCILLHTRLQSYVHHEKCSHDPYFKQSQFTTMEEVSLDAIASFREFVIESSPPTTTGSQRPTTPSQQDHPCRRFARLPPLHLPKFSGRYKEGGVSRLFCLGIHK